MVKWLITGWMKAFSAPPTTYSRISSTWKNACVIGVKKKNGDCRRSSVKRTQTSGVCKGKDRFKAIFFHYKLAGYWKATFMPYCLHVSPLLTCEYWQKHFQVLSASVAVLFLLLNKISQSLLLPIWMPNFFCQFESFFTLNLNLAAQHSWDEDNIGIRWVLLNKAASRSLWGWLPKKYSDTFILQLLHSWNDRSELELFECICGLEIYYIWKPPS